MHLPFAYAEQEAAESDDADVWYALADEAADAAERRREDLLDRLAPARELALHGACSIERRGSRLHLGDGSIWEEQGDGRVTIVAAPASLAAALMTARAAALWGTPL
jgi:plasmid stabilization system protein ParE